MTSAVATGVPKKVWVDVLCAPSIACLRRWLRTTDGTADVCYGSVAEARVSPLHLARRAGLSIVPLPVEIGDLRTREGAGIRFAIEETILDWLPARLRAMLAASPLAAPEDVEPERVWRYLLKEAAVQVRPALTLAYAVRAMDTPGDELPVLLVADAAAEILGSHPALRGFDVWRYGRTPTTVAARLLRGFGILVRASASAVRWSAAAMTVSDPPPDSPQIAVQWVAGMDETAANDYPWFAASGIAPGHVTFYADRPDRRLDAPTADAIRAKGHHWVSRDAFVGRPPSNRRRVGLCLARPFVNLGRSVRAVLRASLSPSPLALWELRHRLSMTWRISHWEAWCRRHRIAALMSFSDSSSMMLAQAIAAERAGGISFSAQWSHYSMDTIVHARDFTVYFAWGPYYLRGFDREGSRIEHLVYTGLIAWSPNDQSASAMYRSELVARGAARSVCFFDNSSGPDAHYSTGALSSLYDALLSEVTRDPSFGLILKPKDREALAKLSALPALAAAQATGRCRVVGPEAAPRTAAAAADLTVGFGFNSAALAAAAVGHPVLYVDLSADIHNPFHVWGDGHSVFSDIDSAMAEVRRRLASPVTPTRGEQVALAAISPFGDADGARRVGWFLKRYVDLVVAGHSARLAAARAVAEYRQQFVREAGADNGARLDGRVAC